MRNPFTPGNGVDPVYLAGREECQEEFLKSLDAFTNGLPRNMVIYGLRGTGKTVLLRHYKVLAEASNWLCIDREFNERYCDETEFAQIFGKDIVSLASEVSLKKKLAETGKKVANALKPEELSAYGISYKPYYVMQKEVLEDYFAELLKSNWPIFKQNANGVLLLYDEFHLIKDKKETKQFVLSSLMSAIAKVQREGCKYYLCVCGLPPLKTNLKEAKTYTERMFLFQEIGNLEASEAAKALNEPLKKSEVVFEPPLIKKIVSETSGYAYFLQFYGYFIIDSINKKKLSVTDLDSYRSKLLKMLDKSFFEDRFALASEKEKKILTVMAKCNGKEIAANLITKGAKISYLGLQQYLVRLIEKGLIYRSKRGYYAFSIPLFRDYLLRQ